MEGPALIICGYLHLDFLAHSIRARGSMVVEKSAYPASLSCRTPTKTFSPYQLESYLREQGGVVEI